jgi:hypothetical protein
VSRGSSKLLASTLIDGLDALVELWVTRAAGGAGGLQSAPVPRAFFRDSAGGGRSGAGAEGGVRASASRIEPRKSCSSEGARPGRGSPWRRRPAGQRQRQFAHSSAVAAAGASAAQPASAPAPAAPAGWLGGGATSARGDAGAGGGRAPVLPGSGWRATRTPHCWTLDLRGVNSYIYFTPQNMLPQGSV